MSVAGSCHVLSKVASSRIAKSSSSPTGSTRPYIKRYLARVVTDLFQDVAGKSLEWALVLHEGLFKTRWGKMSSSCPLAREAWRQYLGQGAPV